MEPTQNEHEVVYTVVLLRPANSAIEAAQDSFITSATASGPDEAVTAAREELAIADGLDFDEVDDEDYPVVAVFPGELFAVG